MKETVNVNVGGRAFTMDRDACNRLSEYLDDIDSRMEESSTTTDIEGRVAEILAELLPSSVMVVTLAMVEQTIVRIGPAEQFGAVRNSKKRYSSQNGTTAVARLRRSRTDRSIAGVCGGLAKYLGIDATVLRVLMLCLIFFGGMSLWVYIIMWLLIPEE